MKGEKLRDKAHRMTRELMNKSKNYLTRVFVLNKNAYEQLKEVRNKKMTMPENTTPITLCGFDYFIEEGAKDEPKIILVDYYFYQKIEKCAEIAEVPFWEMVDRFDDYTKQIEKEIIEGNPEKDKEIKGFWNRNGDNQ